MKKILLIIILFLSNNLFAQTIKISEPEFSGNAVFVNSNDGNGIPLETTQSSKKTKAGASVYLVGVGKVHTDASVKGSTSNVRIKQHEKLLFIYRAENNTINPKEIIQLIRFKVKGKNRRAELASVGTFSGASSGDMGFIDFSATKYGTSSYLISVSNLSAGEYGFSFGKENSPLVHMFTIIADGSNGYINTKHISNVATNQVSNNCTKYLNSRKVGKQILIVGAVSYGVGFAYKLISGNSFAIGSSSSIANYLQVIGIISAGAGLTINLIARNNIKNSSCKLQLKLSPTLVGLAYNFNS